MMRYLAALLCITAMAGCSMLDLPAKFEAENKKGTKTRAAIVKLQDEVIEDEKYLQDHWSSNTSESNVDYTPSPPDSGNVILDEEIAMENLEQNSWFALTYWLEATGDETPEVYFRNYAWQSIRQASGESKTINSVKVYLKQLNTFNTVYCEIWSASKTSQIGTTITKNISSTTGEWITFDFSSQSISIADDTEYWVKVYSPDAVGGSQVIYGNYIGYQNTDVYSNGQLDITGTQAVTNIGDATFQVLIDEGLFPPSGNITTDNFDLGSTPTVTGEWQIQDTKPDGTNLTYEAWSSATGVFGGEEDYLGTVADGDPITDLKQYYRVKSFFTSNTARYETPTLQSIKADFSIYIDVIAHAAPGSLSGLESIGTLSTEISDFKPTTISSMTVTFPFSKLISTWFATRYPKNRIVKVKYGFIAPGFTPADYIDRFFGQIEDWKISSSGKVTVTIYSFHKEWKTKIPRKWETSSDDKEWIEEHPVDVILDILQNFLTVRDSKINYASFYAVRDALPGWKVTRKITENTEEAKAMMEELRGLMTCYFTLHGDGSVGLKRWDANETPVATLTDKDFLPPGPSWSANAKSLINEVFIYFSHGEDGAGNYTTPTAGDEEVNFRDLGTDFNGDSIDNWQETAPKVLKDKWTRSTEVTQVATRVASTLDRYKDPRSLLSVSLSGKWIALETGDIVNITTKRYPSTDFTGCTDKPFQIVKTTPNWLKKSGAEINLVLLEV